MSTNYNHKFIWRLSLYSHIFSFKGEFVLEYEGDFIEKEEALRREELYREEHLGSFIVNATWKGRPVYIDGTLQFDSMGRLVNHARGGNLKPFRLLQVRTKKDVNKGLVTNNGEGGWGGYKTGGGGGDKTGAGGM